MPLAVEVGAGLAAAVRTNAVPDQEDMTVDVSAKVADEANDVGRSHAPGLHHQKRASVFAVRTVGNSSDRGEMLPRPHLVS